MVRSRTTDSPLALAPAHLASMRRTTITTLALPGFLVTPNLVQLLAVDSNLCSGRHKL